MWFIVYKSYEELKTHCYLVSHSVCTVNHIPNYWASSSILFSYKWWTIPPLIVLFAYFTINKLLKISLGILIFIEILTENLSLTSTEIPCNIWMNKWIGILFWFSIQKVKIFFNWCVLSPLKFQQSVSYTLYMDYIIHSA